MMEKKEKNDGSFTDKSFQSTNKFMKFMKFMKPILWNLKWHIWKWKGLLKTIQRQKTNMN